MLSFLKNADPGAFIDHRLDFALRHFARFVIFNTESTGDEISRKREEFNHRGGYMRQEFHDRGDHAGNAFRIGKSDALRYQLSYNE